MSSDLTREVTEDEKKSISPMILELNELVLRHSDLGSAMVIAALLHSAGVHATFAGLSKEHWAAWCDRTFDVSADRALALRATFGGAN